MEASVEIRKKTTSSVRRPKYPADTPRSSARGIAIKLVSPPISSATRAPFIVR